jgi:hypothetical protein
LLDCHLFSVVWPRFHLAQPIPVFPSDFARGLLIALIMEALRTPETSVKFDETTRNYIRESCDLHTGRRQNLKSHERSRSCFGSCTAERWPYWACNPERINLDKSFFGSYKSFI